MYGVYIVVMDSDDSLTVDEDSDPENSLSRPDVPSKRLPTSPCPVSMRLTHNETYLSKLVHRPQLQNKHTEDIKYNTLIDELVQN